MLLFVICTIVGCCLLGGSLMKPQFAHLPLAERWLYFLDDLDLPQSSSWVFTTGLVVLAVLFFQLFGVPGLALTALLVWAGPTLLKEKIERHRRHKFEFQIPSALETVAGGLRSGQTLTQSLSLVAEQFPAPTCDVFAQAIRKIQLGEAVSPALLDASKRYHVREWQMYVDVLDVLTKVGGNLAEVTQNTAKTMRRRLDVFSKLNTLTAQGRFQAIIMALLPVAMVVMLRTVDPQLYDLLTKTAIGWFVLAGALILELIAIVLMRQILSIDV